MQKGKFSFQYAVVNQEGEISGLYPIECKFYNPLGVATCAAEAYDALPDSAGASWPLTFVVYRLDGREYCRHEVKRWLVPHFLITSGAYVDVRSGNR